MGVGPLGGVVGMRKDSTEGDFCREFCERFGGLFALSGPELVRRAADSLLAIRPLAIPNRLVLRLGLEEFLPHPLGQTLSKALVEEPRIRRNFFD
ncbi:MAG TPA: hypothetical protein DDZ88_04405 [Verrucomicrobiales bacterium]|nr:hypothetical protein [Verrucomicrobiales bacterium]